MANDEPQTCPVSRLLRLLIPFLTSDLVDVLVIGFRLAKRTFSVKAHEDMYEVLDYAALLDLQDMAGKLDLTH